MKKHYQILTTAGLIVLATVLRLSLGASSPTPFGYVYDFYHEPIEMYHTTGDLPESDDCWQCYHPPLYTILGQAIYSAGMAASDGDHDTALRWLAWFSTCTSFVFIWFCYLIVRRFVTNKTHLALLMALLVTQPCLLFCSYSVEADLLCATFMVMAFTFYLSYAASQQGWISILLMGICSGLAAGTKYSGLIICMVIALLMGYAFIRKPSKRLLAHLTVYFCITALVGGWKYIDNILEDGQPLVGNSGFSSGHKLYLDQYEFNSFRFKELIELMAPDSPDREMSLWPVYDESVFSSLYGQIWTDVSVFSNPSRHEGVKYPYKAIPISLVVAILIAGFVPMLVGGAGTAKAIRHFSVNLPLLLLLCLTLAIFTRWFLGGTNWMLKTKYLLCLSPVGLIFCGYGLDLARNIHRHLETSLMTLLWITVAVSCAYGLLFALT